MTDCICGISLDMIQIKYNVLPNHLSNGVAANFPDCNWEWWHKYSDNNSYKYGSLDRLRFPRICQVALDQLAISLSHTIDTVFPKGFIDFEYYAGGLHKIPPNGWLSKHLDADKHPIYPWKRVGSIVYFCNSWQPDWGGHLIIKGKTVVPEFNKAVLFKCDNESWHSVTQVTGPYDRNSLALFVWEKDETYESKRQSAEFIH